MTRKPLHHYPLRCSPHLLLATLFGLAGCGQKGPLFLPGDTAAEQTEISAEQAEKIETLRQIVDEKTGSDAPPSADGAVDKQADEQTDDETDARRQDRNDDQ